MYSYIYMMIPLGRGYASLITIEAKKLNAVLVYFHYTDLIYLTK